MYSATRSRIFSSSSESGGTLTLSDRHGLSPKARQISATGGRSRAGVFLVLVPRAPATVWEVKRTKSGVIRHTSRI